MNRKSALPVILCLLAFFVLLVFRAQSAVSAAQNSLSLCAVSLIPSLFPFSVTSNLLVAVGVDSLARKRTARLMRLLFGQSPAGLAPLLLGALGGYPLGAQTLAALYAKGALTRREAVRLSMFCNNAGPSFLIGAVGLSLFQSVRIGVLLWCVHLLCALCVGVITADSNARSRSALTQMQADPLPLIRALPEAVGRSCKSMLLVCGFVTFFGVLTALLCETPLFRTLPPEIAALAAGFLEMTNGLFSQHIDAEGLRFVLASFLLAWGGVCVHFQSATALLEAELPIRPYLTGKALQALLSLPVAAAAAGIAGLRGPQLFPHQTVCSVLAALLLVILLFFLKNTGKRTLGLL